MRTPSDNLIAIVEIKGAPRNLRLNLSGAIFVGSDGRQVKSIDTFGPDEALAGATVTAALFFPSSNPSGRIVLTFYDDETYENADVTIPVP